MIFLSIATKLNYLNETKESIKDAIIAKGVEVSDNDTFRDYATKISDISSGGGDGMIINATPITYSLVKATVEEVTE